MIISDFEPRRVIGRFTGKDRGPLLICIAGVHGNEPAGVKALDLMFKMLEVEPITNPEFTFKGRMLGLLGNLKAFKKGQRFIEKDLNRQWTPENVQLVRQSPADQLPPEKQEMKELLEIIESEIKEYQPEKLVILDLHTTTAHGGIFTIPTEDEESLGIAIELHAPVITGLLRGIRGTTLHYFKKETTNVPTVALCFESGQHNDPLSINRAIAAITNCLRTIECVKATDVENRHDALLQEYSNGLPKVADLISIHSIKPGDEFRMEPNYENFQPVSKGALLATDKNGEITAPEDALVLMPLYQKQGDDGFFLVKKVDL